jgi:Putative zinc-finger
MDHSEVVRLKAIERYILGELPPNQREEFEEHYFDCPECAEEVKALATFVTAGRMITEEDLVAKTAPQVSWEQPREWFAWLRPVIAVPAITALAAVVVFQSAVTIPALKKQSAAGSVGDVYQSSFRVQGSTRGESVSTVAIRGDQSFALDFDFTPAGNFESYTGTLVDAAGLTVLKFNVRGEDANKELHLVIPAGKVSSGKYELIFAGNNGTTTGPVDEVQHLSFLVQVQP